MAEEEVRKLYGRIKYLRSVPAGVGGDVTSEIYRLWVLIDHIFQMEGGNILEEMEDKSLATELGEELGNAKHQMLHPEEWEENSLAEFPKYLELPSVVRKKILSYLALDDLLSLISAIPSEASLLKRPLAFYKLKKVLQVMIRKNIGAGLSEVDGWNLFNADTQLTAELMEEIRNNSKDVFEPNIVIDHKSPEGIPDPLEFKLLPQEYEAALDKLRDIGERVVCCRFEFARYTTAEQVISCLKLLPNMISLFVNFCDVLEGELRVEALPDLPFLKHLLSGGWMPSDRDQLSHFKSALVQKYGGQLKFLYMTTHEMPAFVFQTPEQGSALKNLKLDIGRIHFGEYLSSPEVILNGLATLAHCPLKTLDLEVNVGLDPLLFLVGCHWGQTLEYLRISPACDTPNNENHTISTTWMSNLQFPKLKWVKITGYSLTRNWSFLALFPALEALAYTGSLYPAIEEGVMAQNQQNLIQLHNDRQSMLRNIVWKLFPKLEKIRFYAPRVAGRDTYNTITREQYRVVQNRNK